MQVILLLLLLLSLTPDTFFPFTACALVWRRREASFRLSANLDLLEGEDDDAGGAIRVPDADAAGDDDPLVAVVMILALFIPASLDPFVWTMDDGTGSDADEFFLFPPPVTAAWLPVELTSGQFVKVRGDDAVPLEDFAMPASTELITFFVGILDF